MIKIITAPEEYNIRELNLVNSIFLAGTIDNGESENWQEETCKWLESTGTNKEIVIFNPRRESWNSEAGEDDIREQIRWELEALEKSRYIIMNILGTSKSPISLMELGLFHKKMVVLCERNFYRYYNIEEVCWRYNIPLINNNSLGTIKHLLKKVILDGESIMTI